MYYQQEKDMSTKVTVTFTVETNSRLHAEHVIETYLKRKGVYPKGEEELTLGRTELRYGYDALEAKQG